MGYTTTLAVLSHALHAYVERCMKTEDVAHQMTRNDLDRAMKEWLCTSKEETKPLRGISYATATRPLRILRKRLEKLMGKSAWKVDPPWSDLAKQQWELL